eukprot:m.108968 g.108968  ORF g.108968 m.108968 type:complete len:55 (-) comp15228_c1_seq1:1802-1966(-)
MKKYLKPFILSLATLSHLLQRPIHSSGKVADLLTSRFHFLKLCLGLAQLFHCCR